MVLIPISHCLFMNNPPLIGCVTHCNAFFLYTRGGTLTQDDHQFGTAEERSLLELVPDITTRPDITVPHESPTIVAQLGPDDPVICPVYPDGMCLYYCVLAAQDALEWIRSHDRFGRALDPAHAASDIEKALAIKARLLQVIYKAGALSTHSRLEHGWGPDAYPGLDELKYVSSLIGGQVVCQCGEIQLVSGSGPVLMHVVHHMVRDGQGVSAPHWSLLQSWFSGTRSPLDTPLRRSQGELGQERDQPALGPMQQAYDVPGAHDVHASASQLCFPYQTKWPSKWRAVTPPALK